VSGYILEGSYEFNFDDVTSRTVGAGEAFYESPNTVMRSRNGSSTEWVRNVIFHLKRKEDPPAVSVQGD
jgi:quercetin dioxygenase-like cupin family protein